MRGDSGVAGEGRVVGVPKFHSWELSAEAADRHLEQGVSNSEEQQTETEIKPALVDANEMQRRFTTLMDKVQPLLATPDVDPTESASESVSTSESATDTSVSKCQAYLDLIDFPEEQANNISDLQSLFKLLTPYLDFQRFHILEMIVDQFKSEKAREKTQKYRDLFDTYKSEINLGKFVLAMAMRTPPENPPFMRPFSLQLESKWATCTIQDLENLLVQILPKSIGHTFVWFCNASQSSVDNSIRLDYVVSPCIVKSIKEEFVDMSTKEEAKKEKRKQYILKSAGILWLSIDGTDITPKIQADRLFQQELLTVPKADKYQTMDFSTEEVKESPPEKSDIEKLKESLEEREEREAELKQVQERAEAKIQKHREELDRAEAELKEHTTKLEAVKTDIRSLKPLTSKLQKLQTQHDTELSKTRQLIDEVSRDLKPLKPKLDEVDYKRSLFETTTTGKFKSIKSEVKAELLTEVRRDIQAEILPFQGHMKKEFEETVCQLRDEMERKMSDMQCKMLQQFVSITNDQCQKIDELRREVLSDRQRLDNYDRRQQNWEFAREIVRELREKPGGRQEDQA